jgi:hypothetical protein
VRCGVNDDFSMGTRSPVTLARLNELIEEQLRDCCEELQTIFEKHRVVPVQAAIDRGVGIEYVFVVARNGQECMYYEDVEDGFNFSRLGADGSILEPGWQQDPLKWALQRWK